MYIRLLPVCCVEATPGSAVCGSSEPQLFWRAMHLCYVDESGSSGTLTLADPTQEPVFVVAAIIVDRACLLRVTNEFLRLKQQFYPAARTVQYLDSIQHVIKGASIRTALRSRNRRNVSHSIGFLDKIVGMLESHQVRILAKCLVKGIDVHNSDPGVYGAAIMHICEHFQSFLGAVLVKAYS